MEDIAPPLQLLLLIKAAIENGESVKTGLVKYILGRKNDYSKSAGQWLLHIESCKSPDPVLQTISSPYRVAVLNTIERGLRGESIYAQLCELEKEIIDVSNSEIDKFVSLLPMRLLVPLILFQFPAYLLLIVGPLIRSFLESL